MNSKHTAQLPQSPLVAYWEYHAEQKDTIVMVHGFRGTHHGLENIVAYLPTHRIIVPDLPGFGESKPFEDRSHTLENYVQFLNEFIIALKLQSPPVLLGHSFGSIIASHFAVKYPEVISRLILINPIGAPALEGPRGVLTRLAIAYYWLGRKLPISLSHSWLSARIIIKIMSMTMAKSKDKKMLAYIHQQHLKYFSTFANPKVVAEAFQASISSDVSHVANRLSTRTLLIAGTLDDITPLEKQKTLQMKIPGAQLHVIKDVGHLIHYETAAKAATAIQKFLQQ